MGKNMLKKVFDKNNLVTLAFLFLTAFLILMFCSRSSFIYPFNNWDDANCFFTVGKSMFRGKVVYKDLYEQKGILLYFIYGLASCISYTTFTGVFLFEVLFACVYEFFLYRILRLYIRRDAALLLSPVTLVLGFASLPFYFGGSAEEFCLPFIAAPIYFLLKYLRGERKERMPWLHIFLSGACAGCIFWIKYTIAGVFLAFAVFAVIAYIIRRDGFGVLIAAGIFLGGAAAVSLPWIIYFAANGALGDFYTVYIYNNIFLYSGSSGIKAKILKIFRVFFIRVLPEGGLFAVPAVVGVIFMFFKDVRRLRLENFFIPVAFVCADFFIYIGGVVGVYYCLPLSFFAVFAVVAAASGVRYLYNHAEVLKKVKAPFAVFAALSLLLSPFFSWLFTPNKSYIGYDKDELFMYQFKEIIEQKENATVLNYGTLDLGVYTVTGKIPVCKYFCGLNIPLDEIQDVQDRFVAEKRVDFVVCELTVPAVISDNYVLLAESHKKFDDSENAIYLYGLKE